MKITNLDIIGHKFNTQMPIFFEWVYNKYNGKMEYFRGNLREHTFTIDFENDKDATLFLLKYGHYINKEYEL